MSIVILIIAVLAILVIVGTNTNKKEELQKQKRYINEYERDIILKKPEQLDTNINESIMNEKYDFIAIDFETANSERISACAIGLAFVRNNQIEKTEFYYIRPPALIFDQRNVSIHHITAKDVESAYTFDVLYNSILKNYFTINLLVLHNSSMDASIIKQLFELHNISDRVNYIDTMQIAKSNDLPGKLAELCFEFNIDFPNRHDAREDATACANVYIELISRFKTIKYIKTINSDSKQIYRDRAASSVSDEKKTELINSVSDNYIKNTDKFSIEGKKVVITGTFSISREEIKRLVQENGGVLVSAVSKKTELVIVGEDAGPSKLDKIKELGIKIIDEKSFFEIIKLAQ